MSGKRHREDGPRQRGGVLVVSLAQDAHELGAGEADHPVMLRLQSQRGGGVGWPRGMGWPGGVCDFAVAAQRQRSLLSSARLRTWTVAKH